MKSIPRVILTRLVTSLVTSLTFLTTRLINLIFLAGLTDVVGYLFKKPAPPLQVGVFVRPSPAWIHADPTVQQWNEVEFGHRIYTVLYANEWKTSTEGGDKRESSRNEISIKIRKALVLGCHILSGSSAATWPPTISSTKSDLQSSNAITMEQLQELLYRNDFSNVRMDSPVVESTIDEARSQTTRTSTPSPSSLVTAGTRGALVTGGTRGASSGRPIHKLSPWHWFVECDANQPMCGCYLGAPLQTQSGKILKTHLGWRPFPAVSPPAETQGFWAAHELPQSGNASLGSPTFSSSSLGFPAFPSSSSATSVLSSSHQAAQAILRAIERKESCHFDLRTYAPISAQDDAKNPRNYVVNNATEQRLADQLSQRSERAILGGNPSAKLSALVTASPSAGISLYTLRSLNTTFSSHQPFGYFDILDFGRVPTPGPACYNRIRREQRVGISAGGDMLDSDIDKKIYQKIAENISEKISNISTKNGAKKSGTIDGKGNNKLHDDAISLVTRTPITPAEYSLDYKSLRKLCNRDAILAPYQFATNLYSESANQLFWRGNIVMNIWKDLRAFQDVSKSAGEEKTEGVKTSHLLDTLSYSAPRFLNFGGGQHIYVWEPLSGFQNMEQAQGVVIEGTKSHFDHLQREQDIFRIKNCVLEPGFKLPEYQPSTGSSSLTPSSSLPTGAAPASSSSPTGAGAAGPPVGHQPDNTSSSSPGCQANVKIVYEWLGLNDGTVARVAKTLREMLNNNNPKRSLTTISPYNTLLQKSLDGKKHKDNIDGKKLKDTTNGANAPSKGEDVILKSEDKHIASDRRDVLNPATPVLVDFLKMDIDSGIGDLYVVMESILMQKIRPLFVIAEIARVPPVRSRVARPGSKTAKMERGLGFQNGLSPFTYALSKMGLELMAYSGEDAIWIDSELADDLAGIISNLSDSEGGDEPGRDPTTSRDPIGQEDPVGRAFAKNNMRSPYLYEFLSLRNRTVKRLRNGTRRDREVKKNGMDTVKTNGIENGGLDEWLGIGSGLGLDEFECWKSVGWKIRSNCEERRTGSREADFQDTYDYIAAPDCIPTFDNAEIISKVTSLL